MADTEFTNEQRRELEERLLDWEVGTLSDDGVERVRELLRESAEARQLYRQHQLMTAALKLEGDAGTGVVEEFALHRASEVVDTSKPGSLSKSDRSRSTVAFAVAGLLIAALGARLAYHEFSATQDSSTLPIADRDQTEEATSRGIALLTRLVDVEWDDDQQTHEVGDALEAGRFALRSGYAQVEFFCGATVVLEGPAELDLKSPTLAAVTSGKLRAQVPPAARGFSLEVDGMKVVDLGTEFGLAVTPDGADVKVFDGEVELHRDNEEPHSLLAGDSVRQSVDGNFDESPVTAADFVDIATLESRSSDQQAERLRQWQQWSKQFRVDSRLVTYHAFDEVGDWERKLSNSLSPSNPELDGAIVGAHRAAGRWPGKNALEFKRPGDRVRVQIPGEYGSLSFACWVKIDSLDRWYNSLFLTDGYQRGEPHWQILDTGQLFFSVRVSEKDGGPEHREVLSPPFWNPSLSGKWLHLATTYDVERKTVRHYLNGVQIHEEQIPDHQLVSTTRFGRATIGNWSSPQRPEKDFAIRNLNGSIGEFALLSGVLTDAEILEMYEIGKP